MGNRLLRCILCAWIVFQVRVAVAEPGGRVAVLHDQDASIATATVNAVDQALLRDLAGLAGIDHPTVVAVSYEETQLNIGCDAETRECLGSIAQTVDADALVIRKLRVKGGKTTLALVYFDVASGKEADIVDASAPTAQELTLADAVPGLVRVLFGLTEPPAASAPAQAHEPHADATTESQAQEPAAQSADDTEPRDAGGPAVAPLTWVLLAAGTVTLAGGIVMGAVAKGSFEDFKRAPTATPAQAREARADFDTAETQGTLATVLIPLGGALITAGAVLLYLDLSADTDSDTRLSLVPFHDGAALSLGSRFGGL